MKANLEVLAGAIRNVLRMAGLTLFLLSAAGARAADPVENNAFAIAARAFESGFYERAENEFAEFINRYPGSERRAEAILAQAQCRFQLKRYVGAINLLNSGLPAAGTLTGDYLFWTGETEFQQLNYAAAIPLYGRVVREFPASKYRVDACYAEALARFKTGEPQRTIDLLKNPAGAFQSIARAQSNEVLVVRGLLLLAEALIADRQFELARTTLQQAASPALSPDLEWERQYILARLDLAAQKPESALQTVTNLVALAQNSKTTLLQVRSFTLQSEIFQLLRLPERAIQSLENIFNSELIPLADRKQALLKIVDSAISLGQFTNAVQRLHLFLGQNPQDSSADLFHLTLGELYLKQFQALKQTLPVAPPVSTLPAGATNLPALARQEFDLILNNFTNSPLAGKAWMNKGWLAWEESDLTGPARIIESQQAFQAAALKLTRPHEVAEARLKTGDCQFQLKDYSGALSNYLAVINSNLESAAGRASVADRAHYQVIRARVELKQLGEANTALEQMIRQFPGSTFTERAMLFCAQALLDNGDPAGARRLLERFAALFPKSEWMAQSQLQMARSYVSEGELARAVLEYGNWLTNHPGDPAQPQAEFDRAWVLWRSGDDTNALPLFTNFVARFPTNSLAPKAQNWIADYYFGQQNWTGAEQNYMKIFLSTNWPLSELSYQARLMAARTAFLRQDYSTATNNLNTLINDPKCPPALRGEAFFVLGDVFVRQPSGSTNLLSNFNEGLNAFKRVGLYASNHLEVLAWGRIGDCHLQFASVNPKSYAEATNAYQKVLDSKLPEVPLWARNQAEYGIAFVLEKLAEGKPPAEQRDLLNQALNRYLNIIDGKNSPGNAADPFWLKQAALRAPRLAEALQLKQQAIKLYQRFLVEVPSMRATWQARIDGLQASPSAASPPL